MKGKYIFVVGMALAVDYAPPLHALQNHKCISFLLKAAELLTDQAWTDSFRDFVEEGSADRNNRFDRKITQIHKHELIAIQLDLDRLDSNTLENRAQIANLQKQRLKLLRAEGRTLNEEELVELITRRGAVRFEIPKSGVNPFDFWTKDRTTETIKVTVEKRDYEIESDKLFVRLPGTSVWIGKYLMTQLQWALLMGSNPSTYLSYGWLRINNDLVDPFKPVQNVAPESLIPKRNINHMLDKLNQMHKIKWLNNNRVGKYFQFRLPTEEELLISTYAGTTTNYSFGNDVSQLPKHGWYYDNSGGRPHNVGILLPNPWGLFDVHGNVSQWSSTEYSRAIPGSLCTYGGNYFTNANSLMSHYRSFSSPTGNLDNISRNVGIRLVMEEKDTP